MKLRRVLSYFTVLLALACTSKKDGRSVAADQTPGAAPLLASGSAATGAALRKVHVRASLEGLDDMLAFAEDVARRTNPEKPLDIRGELQADALQAGFGPGFYESLDLAGMFAVDLGWPLPEAGQRTARASDWEIAGIVPTLDARRLIDSMPDTNKPQPLSDGLWELVSPEFSLKLRAKDRTLEFGRDIADLDRAAQLPKQMGHGRRFRARVWNLPREWLDLEPWMGATPTPGLTTAAEVVRETEALELEGEMGTDRDLVVVAAAQAPFSKLGLGPLGSPMTTESELARVLPPGAALAIAMPWGNPKLLHALLEDNVDTAGVPAPFDTIVSDAIGAVHSLLDQLRGETILAVYIDKGGRATVVLAARVSDATQTKQAVRTLLGATEKAFAAHIALQGDAANQKYRVSLARDRRVSKAKVDTLTVTVPRSLQPDLVAMAMLLGRKEPKLEAHVLVDRDVALLAFGAGAKQTMADIGRNLGKKRGKSLESDGGLALARRIDGGCQFCLAVDPVLATRLYFVLERDKGTNKRAGDAMKKLDKVRLRGQAAFAIKLADRRGSIGLAFPRALIADDPESTRRLNELIEQVNEADAKGDVWDGLPAAGAGG